MKNKNKFHKTINQLNQNGLTLIELMISMVLGLAVMGAAIQGFLTHITTQKFTEEMTRMNERGRFSLSVLERAIRNSGNAGCPSDAIRNANDPSSLSASINFVSNVEINNKPAWFANFHYFIEGLSPQNPNYPANALDDSSAIIVHRVSPEYRGVVLNHTQDQLILTQAHRFEKGAPLLVLGSDCKQAALFEITAGDGTNTINFGTAGNNCRAEISGAGIGCNLPLKSIPYVYGQGSEVLALASQIFYVNKDHQMVYLQADKPDKEVILVDDVEFAQFTYGIDSDEDDVANTFVEADQLGADDYKKITSIDFSIVVKSRVPILPLAKVKTCKGKKFTEDKHLRACYQSRINIRNRGGSRLTSS